MLIQKDYLHKKVDVKHQGIYNTIYGGPPESNSITIFTIVEGLITKRLYGSINKTKPKEKQIKTNIILYILYDTLTYENKSLFSDIFDYVYVLDLSLCFLEVIEETSTNKEQVTILTSLNVNSLGKTARSKLINKSYQDRLKHRREFLSYILNLK